MLGIVLPLVSSACWGGADFVGGLLSRRLPVLTVVFVSQLVGATTVVIVAVALREPLPTNLLLPMAGGALGACGLVLFYRGLAIGTMSIVAPIAACGAVIPVVYSIATGQVPRPLVTVGLLSALAGVVLASFASGIEVESSPNRRPRLAAAAAIGAAVGFGLFLLLLGRASIASPGSRVWLAAAARAGSLPLLTLMLIATRSAPPWRGLGARDLGGLAAIGLGDVTANTLFLFATGAGTLAVAAVLGSLYPIGTVLLARLVLGERVTATQATGAGLAMLGVALVSAG
ncbi:MAG TPA: DMT family transporter [Candidatus Solibacter sp.]|jgi:drug/metabolite transporter (DMT)-like permease|nr:DMT family transporter [Candidatus Solibacter sp.]